VLLIGGSGGGIGWQDYMGRLLAERGIVAMGVAYFALDSLPKDLERIPLESFDRAVEWLMKQPYVDAKRVGLGGVSKGAEAALLVAASHPELKGVAVFSPSGVVFQSITRDFRNTSSWTRGGEEVPFVKYGSAPQGSPLVDYYMSGLKQATPAVLNAATIRVERIGAPILMLSGRSDTMWGSGYLADMIASRLRANGFRPGFENIVYPDAGHLISSIRDDDVTYRGGTKEGNAAAQRDAQRRFLEFFVRVLRVQ
jgi:dienelactone hydrolase